MDNKSTVNKRGFILYSLSCQGADGSPSPPPSIVVTSRRISVVDDGENCKQVYGLVYFLHNQGGN
jgi:hypothetical protein